MRPAKRSLENEALALGELAFACNQDFTLLIGSDSRVEPSLWCLKWALLWGFIGVFLPYRDFANRFTSIYSQWTRNLCFRGTCLLYPPFFECVRFAWYCRSGWCHAWVAVDLLGVRCYPLQGSLAWRREIYLSGSTSWRIHSVNEAYFVARYSPCGLYWCSGQCWITIGAPNGWVFRRA